MSSYDFLGPYTPNEGVFDDEGLGPYGMPGSDPDEDFEEASGPVAGPNYLLGSGLSIDEGSQDYLDDDVPFGAGVYLTDEFSGYDDELDDDDDEWYGDDDDDEWDEDGDWFLGDVFGASWPMPAAITGGSEVKSYLHYLVDHLKSRLIQAGYPMMSEHPKIVELHSVIESIDPPGANWTEAGGVKISQMFRRKFLDAMVNSGMSHEWRTRYLDTLGRAMNQKKGLAGPAVPKKQVSAVSKEPEAVATRITSPEKASGVRDPVKPQVPPPHTGTPRPGGSTVTEVTHTSPTGATTTTTTQSLYPGQPPQPSGRTFPISGTAGIAIGLAGVALIGLGLYGKG